ACFTLIVFIAIASARQPSFQPDKNARSVTQTEQSAKSSVIFHHVHLNSIDPPAAMNFYTKTFDVTKKAALAGFDGIQSEKMYLLFNKVKVAPPVAPDSAIWHFGWGSMAMETDYQKHLASGV